MSYENFFWAKTSVALFPRFENMQNETLWRKRLKRAQLTCESRGYRITGIQLQKPVIEHPRDRALITWQIGARRTNHDR